MLPENNRSSWTGKGANERAGINTQQRSVGESIAAIGCHSWLRIDSPNPPPPTPQSTVSARVLAVRCGGHRAGAPLAKEMRMQ